MQDSTSKDINPQSLDDLFQAIGWGRRGEEKWKRILESSSYVYSVWDNKTLVGLGRILEDGVMCMMYDIGVHPNYQRRGIGTQIMNYLIEQVKDQDYVSIGLFAWEENPKNRPFYEDLGFEHSAGMELKRYMHPEGE
jgi:ribosomal protein S18 acetylase RimI-like enzyme